MERRQAARCNTSREDSREVHCRDGARGPTLRLYVDTSALLKLYVDEPDSSIVREHLNDAVAVATSLVTYAEARAALARRQRSGDLSRSEHTRIVRVFEDDWDRYNRIEVTEPLIRTAADLAERHRLRAYDAIHLASALRLRERPGAPSVFASWDDRLDQAASREGFALLRSRRR